MSTLVNIKGNKPGFSMRNGRVLSINKIALRLLGCPRHILFWHSENENTLFIAASDGTSALSFPVSDMYYRSKSGYQLENKNLIRAVKNCAKWGSHSTCAVDGEYLDDLGMVAFRLDNTRIEEVAVYE